MSTENSSSDQLKVEQYFAAIDAVDVDGAIALFAEGAEFVRPAMDAKGRLTGGAEVLTGRTAIHEYLVARGAMPYRHRVVRRARGEGMEYLDGIVAGGPGGPQVVFFARAAIDGDGLITRYDASAMALGAGMTDQLVG